ncbi:GNAT family N-acetyltransferase [Leptospira limi]|uniref:GNAT family N-acetyltransferase n=1 Tax=Leptospira limi TaxID=2950023 RepID=A0ABT3LZP3_9LEPT|nr:GNAT family N-acetyltransferase [Leptospira limi]MCW7462950.1 GNAT family N-acetyltransferase [Leptospira limi]
MILVEDCAHVLKPIKGIGEKGDFVLYSPHKHLPIPEGAALIIRNSGPSQIEWKDEDTHQIVKLSKGHYLKVKNTRFYLLTWFSKRLAQKIGIRSRNSNVPNYNEDSLNQTVAYPLMANVSKRFLISALSSIGEVVRHKFQIQRIWDAVLDEFIPIQSERSESYIPYLTEYNFPNLEIAKANFERLYSLHYPVSVWPDLPPEIRSNPLYYKSSIHLRETSFYLPTHFSLSSKEVSLFSNSKNSNIFFSLEATNLDEENWNSELNSIDAVNLLQTLFYGEAKKHIEGWGIKRILLKSNGKKIGLVQVLSKTYFYLFHVLRINRGPLFYEGVSEEEKKSALHYIAKWVSKFSFLFINPEMLNTGKNLVSLFRMGYRTRRAIPWSSSLVDLSLDLDDLRKELDGKWRNMLNAAEKTELKLVISETEESFQWILDRYSELMNQKEFSGIPISFLKGIKAESDQNQKLVQLIAMYQGEKVAGICISMANGTGTYLVGWNGEEGRKLKANQYLLWNAIVYLRSQCCRYFDLGGIDEENTPKIAEFKIGVNGQRYELAGEFVR